MGNASLENMHGFVLAQVRADRALRTIVSSKLKTQRLTLMEWLALGAIGTGSRQGLSMSEIAEVLEVTLPQVTSLVIGLLDHKFVKQKVLVSDHRGRQVIVTLKGKRVLAKMESVVAGEVKEWTKTLPSNRTQEYMRTVRQLSES